MTHDEWQWVYIRGHVTLTAARNNCVPWSSFLCSLISLAKLFCLEHGATISRAKQVIWIGSLCQTSGQAGSPQNGAYGQMPRPNDCGSGSEFQRTGWDYL